MRIEQIGRRTIAQTDLPGVRRLEWHAAAAPDGVFCRLPLPDLVVILNVASPGWFRLRAVETWQPLPAASIRGLCTTPSDGRDPSSGRIGYVSLVIEPWSSPIYLGQPASVFAGRIENAAVVWPDAPQLLDGVACAASVADRLAQVCTFLTQRFARHCWRATERADRRLWGQLHAGDSVSVVASTLGVSTRRVHQRCLQSFGVSARHCTQLSRFGRLLERVAATLDGPVPWTQEFADQSHATRTFRRFAATTPGQYRASRRGVAQPYSIVGHHGSWRDECAGAAAPWLNDGWHTRDAS